MTALAGLSDADRAPLDALNDANLATLLSAVQPIFRVFLHRIDAGIAARGLVGEYTSGWCLTSR